MSKIIIDVRGGLVQAVFARRKDLEVEVIDWDAAEDDEEYAKKAEKRWKQIENAKTYKQIY